MRIAFFGTSDKSEPIMESLSKYLYLCITKEDTLVGRKQEKRQTGVKKWAIKNNVEYFEIRNLKDDIEKLIQVLKEKNIELGIMADFSFIVPEKIISTIKHGIINIHFSLLPKLRGASPIPHAIKAGYQQTGISYYLMDKGMDTGSILAQNTYIMSGKETTDTLNKALFSLAGLNIEKIAAEYIQGKLTPIKQDDTQATYCTSQTNPKSTLIDKNDAKINWEEDPIRIERQIRAYIPWPVAWTTLEELEKYYSLKLRDNVDKKLRVKIFESQVVSNRLTVIKLQVEGKNETNWESFINGYTQKS